MAKMGCPTKYRKIFCKQLIEYFTVDHFDEDNDKACEFPTLAGFAGKLGVAKSTLNMWRDANPEFSVALGQAKALQEDILAKNAIFGRYHAGFAGLFAKNCLDWTEKSETKNTHKVESLEDFLKNRD